MVKKIRNKLLKLKRNIKSIIVKLKQSLIDNIEEILLIGGCLLIILATFSISTILGLYIAGLIMVIFGIVLIKYQIK